MAELKGTAKSGKYEIRLYDDNSIALFAKGVFGMKEVSKIDDAVSEIMQNEGIMPSISTITLHNRRKLRMCYDAIKGLPNKDLQSGMDSLNNLLGDSQDASGNPASSILSGISSAATGDIGGAIKAGADLLGGFMKKKK